MQPLRLADPQGVEERRAPAGGGLAGLGNRFVSLFARRLPRLDFASEVARLLRDLLRLQAVAVLGYQVRRERLVLLAAEGLDTDAVAALGAGEACLWDIPNRCLRNRRISLIAHAHRNPFVPRSLAELSRRGLTVVAVPVLENDQPAGVVLLFAGGARAFADQDLYTLSQALLVCGPVFREVEEGVGRTEPVTLESTQAQETLRKLTAAGAIIDPAAVRPAPPPSAPVEPADLQRVRPIGPAESPTANDRAEVQAEEIRQMREELDQAAARIRQLTLQNHSLLRERDELAQQVEELRAVEASEVARLKAELDAAQDRLVALEAERARTVRLSDSRVQALQQSLSALEKEREVLQSRGSNAEAQLAEWQTLALAVFDERDRLVGQIQALEAELRQQQEALARTRQAGNEERASLEADRNGWKEEARATRAKLIERTNQVAGLERELRATTVQRDALADQLAQARAEIQRLAELAETFHGQFADSETARAALVAELATVRRQREEERQRWGEIEAAHREELEAARREWEELTASFEALQAQYRQQLEASKAVEATLEELRAEHARVRSQHEQMLPELEAAARERSELAIRLDRSEKDRSELARQRLALVEEIAELRQNRVELEAALASAEARSAAERTAWLEREAQLRALQEDLTRRLNEVRLRFEEENKQVRILCEERDGLKRERSMLQERLATALADLERLGERALASDESVRLWQERYERLQLRLQEELQRHEQLRTFAEQQAGMLEEEKARLLEQIFHLETELRHAVLSRDSLQGERQTLAERVAELSARYEETRALLVAAEQARIGAEAELGRLRSALAEERNVAEAAQRALRAELQALRSEWERLHSQLPLLRTRLEEEEKLRLQREQELEELQRAQAELRQQVADRAALARQSQALAQRVVELEQELGTARTEAARAQVQTASEWEARVVALEKELAEVRGQMETVERARAAAVEELEVLREVHQESEVVADRRVAALRESVDRLLEERRRLEQDLARSETRIEAQRAAVIDLQQRAEEARSEREQAREEARQLAEQVATAQRQLEQLASAMARAGEETARVQAERAELVARIEELTGQLEHAREQAAATDARLGEMAAEFQREREVWQQALQKAREAQEKLQGELERARQEAEQTASGAEASTQRLRELERESGRWQEAAAEARREWEFAVAALEQEREQRRAETRRAEEELEAAREQAQALRSQLEQWQAEAHETEERYRAVSAQRRELEESLGRLERDNAALREQLQRLQAEMETAQSAQGEQSQNLLQQLHATQTRLRALEQEKTLLEGALADHQKRTRDLATAHAAAVGELQTLTENLRRQVAELNAGRAQLYQRLEQAEGEVRSWREKAEREESERAAVAERYRRLEEQLTASERRRDEIDRELTRLRQEQERWERQAKEQQAWVEQASALAAQVAKLEQQLSELQGELARSERQRSALEEERRRGEEERAELLGRLAEEQRHLEEQRLQMAEERKRMESLLAQQQHDFESERRSLAELRAAWQRLQEDKLAVEQDRIELAQRLQQGESRLVQLEAELEEQREIYRRLAVEKEELAEALRNAQEAVAELSRANGNGKLERVLAREVHEVVPRRTVDALAGDDDVRAEAEELEVGSCDVGREMVLFDSSQRAAEASAALRAAGFEVLPRPADERSVAELANGNVGYVLMNLAAGPQAWRTLVALRRNEACRPIKILAYAMPPNGDKGFCFGRAEFDLWPGEPERVLGQLNWLRPKLRRLLAVSADVEVMGKLREPLAKASVSTSIVLDGKQALEFTSIVAPEAAVVHLSPATSGVARAIAGIRNQEATADLPLLVLLDPTPAREEQFYAATVRELLFRGSFQFAQLPAELARVLS